MESGKDQPLSSQSAVPEVDEHPPRSISPYLLSFPRWPLRYARAARALSTPLKNVVLDTIGKLSATFPQQNPSHQVPVLKPDCPPARAACPVLLWLCRTDRGTPKPPPVQSEPKTRYPSLCSTHQRERKIHCLLDVTGQNCIFQL